MTARKQGRTDKRRSRQKESRPGFPDTLERIAARDKTALLELYARLAPGLLAITFQITSDPEDAASAVEETFVRLWREASRFPREAASVNPWLVLTARRMALQKRLGKHAAQRGSNLAHDLVGESYAWLPSQDEFTRLEQRRELLRKTLRQLPTHQHEALMLAVWEGLGEEAIAQRLGEPLARVQAALRAGMRFIRHRMRVVLGTWSAHI
jgi:RNA polymerase sigma-70 factor (ECF subfamily)